MGQLGTGGPAIHIAGDACRPRFIAVRPIVDAPCAPEPDKDAFHLPARLNPGGRVTVLTFHSGEDRRVKKAFAAGCREALYAEIAQEVICPTADERHANPRSAPAKLRWARKAGGGG
jgi:hypothetical protein